MPTFGGAAANQDQWNGGAAASAGSITAQKLIYGAFRLIGVLRAGQTTSPENLADGLAALNDLLDEWNLDRLKAYSIAREVYVLPAAKTVYTMGPDGGDILAPRPVRITNASVLVPFSPEEIEQPLAILSLPEWQRVRLKGIDTPIPAAFYCDYAAPAAHLSLFPIPTGPISLVLYHWVSFAAFASLTDSAAFPPGYALALRYNLALQLEPMFAHKAVNKFNLAAVERIARQSLSHVRQANLPRNPMRCDPAVLSRHSHLHGVRWDARSGSWL